MLGRKNTIVLLLIGTSVALLITLQFFWLQSAYEKAHFDFNRDANFIFRNTLFALRDSIFAQNIEPIPGDSTLKLKSRVNRVELHGKDSLPNKFQVFVTGESHFGVTSQRVDSVLDVLRPLSMKFQSSENEGYRSFIIRVTPDSINEDTLRLNFSEALAKAGYHQDFIINHLKVNPSTEDKPGFNDFNLRRGREDRVYKTKNIYGDSLMTETFRLNPIHQYNATMLGINSLMLHVITPQILFSVFLTLMILIAFIVLYRSLRSQQRLMDMKNDFINNITHELKTPVATVSVAIEALKNFNGLENPKLTEEYLTIAQNELNRLTIMTDKILKTSVFEKEGVEFALESVDLEKITEQVLHSFKLIAEKQEATISFSKSGSNFTVRGSVTHLTNVLYNLIDNALKYSPRQASIQVSIEETPQNILIKVQDNGIGIPLEYQKKVFEKFFRVPTGDVHNAKGYGLGLSYVYGVIKSHKGTIDLLSTPGNGSTFTIQLLK